MFLEYSALMGWNGESLLSVGFVSRLLLIMAGGLVLIMGGYAIRGVWGALISVFVGSFLFLYFNGLLPL